MENAINEQFPLASMTDTEGQEVDMVSVEEEAPIVQISHIPVSQLFPHPDNPRKEIGDITELADSIKTNGIYQNLTVVPSLDRAGSYTVIIGHRRLAAAKQAGLATVPCVVVMMTPKEQLQTMLLENMQRVDLTVYEQAQGFQMMIDMGDTPDEIADKTGFSRTTVRRRLKMAELDQAALKKVSDRQLSLADFDRLAQIESVDTRNKVLMDIGTYNFDNAVSRAIKEEKRKKVLPLAKKLIKELGLKAMAESDRWSGKFEKVKSFNLDSWNPEKGFGLKTTTEIFYHLDQWGDLSFYRKKPKAAPEKKSKEQIAKEKAIAEAHAAIGEEKTIAFELRQKFVNGLSVNSRTAPLILQGAVMAIVSGSVLYKSADRSHLMKLFGVDPDGAWNKVRKDTVAALTTSDIAALAPEVVYTAFQDSKSNGYSSTFKGEWPKHEENLMLDALYSWLEIMGYEMSDSEKQLQDGSHELFVSKV